MNARRKARPAQPGKAAGRAPHASALTAVPAGNGQWRLVHPRCAQDRAEDIANVEQMLDAGEVEIATDELRWLLEGCTELVKAHRLLGEIAMADGDLKLARGHLGYAYRVGLKAIERSRMDGTLPYMLAENRDLHEAAKGLAWCLRKLGKRRMASDVADTMLRWDPTDPLGVRAWQAGDE